MIDSTAASTKTPPLPPTLRDENRRLRLLQESQAGTIRSLMDEVTRLSGELRDCTEDRDRYDNRVFLLAGAVANLKDEVAELEKERDELEDRFSEELEDDLENDPPCEEPRQPEDMPARHGLNVAAGLERGGGS